MGECVRNIQLPEDCDCGVSYCFMGNACMANPPGAIGDICMGVCGVKEIGDLQYGCGCKTVYSQAQYSLTLCNGVGKFCLPSTQVIEYSCVDECPVNGVATDKNCACVKLSGDGVMCSWKQFCVSNESDGGMCAMPDNDVVMKTSTDRVACALTETTSMLCAGPNKSCSTIDPTTSACLDVCATSIINTADCACSVMPSIEPSDTEYCKAGRSCTAVTKASNSNAYCLDACTVGQHSETYCYCPETIDNSGTNVRFTSTSQGCVETGENTAAPFDLCEEGQTGKACACKQSDSSKTAVYTSVAHGCVKVASGDLETLPLCPTGADPIADPKGCACKTATVNTAEFCGPNNLCTHGTGCERVCAAGQNGCETCTNNKCTKCEDAHFDDGNMEDLTCTACPANCTACSSATACSTCSTGYKGATCADCDASNGYVTDGAGGCKLACTVENCTKCENGDADSCETCKAKYYKDSTSGKTLCTACPTNCTECTSATACSACEIGYSGTTCATCAEGYAKASGSEVCTKIECDTNCDVCLATDNCKTCKPTYITTGEENKKTCMPDCLGAIAQCETCAAADTCSKCKAGYKDATCNACDTGYTAVPSSNPLVCKLTTCVGTIPQCDECADAQKCLKCKDGYEGNTCTKIACPTIAQCSLCKSSTECHTCKDGYTGNTCTQVVCDASASKCELCSATDTKTCVSCKTGYAHPEVKCVVCDTENGYVTGEETGICKPTCKVPNCTKCESGNTDSCETCNADYIIIGATGNKTCMPDCLSAIPQCETCTDADTCSKCITGYQNPSTKCVEMTCASSVENCISCTVPNGTACKKCETGFNDDVTTGTCVANTCPANCQSCGTPIDRKNCSECKPGFYLTGADGAKTCTACPTNCTTCTSATSCQTCNNGFAGTTCSVCDTGYTGAKCNSCDIGYQQTSSGSDPLVCAKIPCDGKPNCTRCSTTGCLACEDDYGLAGVAGSQTCNQKATCSDGANNCTTCKDKYDCQACAEGYETKGTAGFVACDKILCGDNCDICATTTSCKTCNTDYTTTGASDAQTCVLDCPTLIPNCAVCSSKIICDKCNTGFTGNDCKTCDTGYTGGNCADCVEGYEKKGNPAICQKIVCDTNCDVCLATDNCKTCKNGFTTTGEDNTKTCMPDCLTAIPQCETCTAADTCLKCNTGYQNPATDCVEMACASSVQNCVSCTTPNGTTCKVCKNGFNDDANLGTCEADVCSANCENCGTPVDRKNCITCKPGFYLTGAQSAKTCAACPTNCTSCSSADSCQSCNIGFTGTTCIDCATGYTGENCATCSAGYAKAPGSNVCAKIVCDEDCDICDTITSCKTCKAGYTTTGAEGAKTCMPDCLTAVTQCVTCKSTTECQVCNPGYEGDTCTKIACPTIAQCTLCKSSTECINCNAGYEGGKCTKVVCDTSVPNCELCNAADTKTCVSCKDGYRNPETKCMAGGVCQPSVPNCSRCSDGKEVCYECRDGYKNALMQCNEMICADSVKDCTSCTEPNGNKCAVCSKNDAKPNKNGECKSGLSGGAIAGIVIAVIVVVAGVCCGMYFFMKKKQQKDSNDADENKNDAEAAVAVDFGAE